MKKVDINKSLLLEELSHLPIDDIINVAYDDYMENDEDGYQSFISTKIIICWRRKPTQSEFDQAFSIINTHKAIEDYKEKRCSEYPTIANQLDMLYHELELKGKIDKTGEFFNAIKNIKDKYIKD